MSDSLLINLSFLLTRPTGTTTYASNLLPHLHSLNPTILVAQNIPSYNCYPVPANQTAEQGVKGHFRRLLWTQRQLPQIYKKLKYNLLFSPLPEAPLFSNCRYIVTVHDLIPLRFPKRFSPLTPYFRYYIPQVLAEAQHIICNSYATAKDITQFFQIPARKITPILLAYDRNHFRRVRGGLEAQRQSSQGRMHQESGSSTRLPYFLYIGRHEPYKNLQRLIAAFAAMPSSGDCELWLAGSFDRRYTPVLKGQVEDLGIATRVKFLDYVPDRELPTIINSAIALVFPSLWEGFGLPVIEAMACGTPVITSNLASLPEVAGDAAILIDPYNVGEITEAMQAVASDSELRSRMSALGLNRANQFSWDKTGNATAELLKRYT